jgi:hypothetical protein
MRFGCMPAFREGGAVISAAFGEVTVAAPVRMRLTREGLGLAG